MNKRQKIISIMSVFILCVTLFVFRDRLGRTAVSPSHDPLPSGSILQTDEKVKRLSITIPLARLPIGESYHAWLVQSEDAGYKYAGAMFEVQGGKYSITFTTEEVLSDYRSVIVSQETTDIPEKPATIIKEWALQI